MYYGEVRKIRKPDLKMKIKFSIKSAFGEIEVLNLQKRPRENLEDFLGNARNLDPTKTWVFSFANSSPSRLWSP